MGINKPDDYAARLKKARRKRNGKDPFKYFLIAAGCVIVILLIVLAGKIAKGGRIELGTRRSADSSNIEGVFESAGTDETEAAALEGELMEEDEEQKPASKSAFDSDHTVTPLASTTAPAASSTTKPFPGGRVNRITTIHPKSYEDAQLVGRALRDGVPVVLNLTGVAEAVAYRIVDFSAGVVFGVRGSLERVTPRVFLLSPAQVNIKVEEPTKPASAHDLFAD